ncbi:MAG: arylformamidase [Planctomycetota bacterium]
MSGRIIDISQAIGPETVVWPGDTKYSQKRVMELDKSCPCNVTTITMSVHCGTHADAPLHYDAAGCTPAEMDLAPFIGPCRVIDVQSDDAIYPSDFDDVDLGHIRRLIFRTKRPSPEKTWRDDYAYMSQEAATVLAAAGVLLVGSDAASMDPMTSKTLDAHKTMNTAGIRWLENLDLSRAPAGDYELIAAPLKLSHADAAPVRALLRTLS